MQFLVVNGPNLDLLGEREPALYGSTTLAQIEDSLKRLAADLGARVECFQSNHEGALIDRIHAARGRVDGVIANLGGYTHTSVAIRDALLACDVPLIEVHLSNLHRREPFRQRSLIADIAVGQVVGLGAQGYELALRALVTRVSPPAAR
ncbi:MAG: type II 3-dehydroquinate dehydratase [Myxococcota bacterium]